VYLRSKALDTISESELHGLVSQAAQETDTAEFKQQMWGKSDDDKREMLRDIVSFANHKGGEIYVGIREEDGIAVEVEGVEGEGQVERIHSSCRSAIDRPLQGLQVYPVPLANERSVIIVRVPYSLNGPHMVTFKGVNQFWVRHGRQKAPMTVDEIEDAFMRRFESETAVERFIAERKERAQTDAGVAPWLFLAVTPIFLREDIIDPGDPQVQRLLTRPPEHPNHEHWILGDVDIHPSLAGLAGEYVRDGQTIRRREVYRNGHVEFGTRTFGSREPGTEDERLAIRAKQIVLQTYSFLRLAVELYREQGAAGPVVLSMALFNATSTRLLYGGLFTEHSARWNEPRLDIPPIYLQELDAEFGAAVKRLNDRFWNAFRLRECPYVTAEGDLTNIG
jgi:hypothetical protein